MGRDGCRWIELALPGAQTHLHFVRRADDKPSNDPVLVLVEEDVKGCIEALRKCGVEIVAEPGEPPWQPGRTVAEFRDSEGNLILFGSP
jgi:hypothetical protein